MSATHVSSHETSDRSHTAKRWYQGKPARCLARLMAPSLPDMVETTSTRRSGHAKPPGQVKHQPTAPLRCGDGDICCGRTKQFGEGGKHLAPWSATVRTPTKTQASGTASLSVTGRHSRRTGWFKGDRFDAQDRDVVYAPLV